MASFSSQGSGNFEDNMDRFPKATSEDLRACGVCSFCLQEITSGRKLECGHVFHEKCMNWLQLGISCPVCRNSFSFQPRQSASVHSSEELLSPEDANIDTKKQSNTKTYVIPQKTFANGSTRNNGLSEPEGGEQEQNGDSASDIIDLNLSEPGFINFQQEVDRLLNEEPLSDIEEEPFTVEGDIEEEPLVVEGPKFIVMTRQKFEEVEEDRRFTQVECDEDDDENKDGDKNDETEKDKNKDDDLDNDETEKDKNKEEDLDKEDDLEKTQ